MSEKVEHLAPPARGNCVSVEGAEHIDQARGGDEASAVIAQSARNIGAEALEEVREIVKNSGAQVGVKTKAAEGVSGVLRKNISAQQVGGDREPADADEKARKSTRLTP